MIRSRLFVALAALGLAATACETAAASGSTTPAASANASAAPSRQAPRDVIECDDEYPTGSHIAEGNCRNKKQREAERQNTMQTLDAWQRNSSQSRVGSN